MLRPSASTDEPAPRRLTPEQRATIEANQRLAYHYGRRMCGVYHWLGEDELVSAALEGLCRAVRCHDPAKGALSTIVHHHMRGAVQKLVRDSALIRTPNYTWHLRGGRRTVHHDQADHVRAMHRWPTDSLTGTAAPEATEEHENDRLHRAIEAMDAQRREVLVRVVMHGEPLRVLARERGCSIETVRQVRCRAVAEIRGILEATKGDPWT